MGQRLEDLKIVGVIIILALVGLALMVALPVAIILIIAIIIGFLFVAIIQDPPNSKS